MKTVVLFVIILIYNLTPSSAQIVNIENARIQTDSTGWAGTVGANFSLVKNTTSIVTIGAEALAQYKTKKDLWLLLADYSFLKTGGKKIISNSFAHFRYNRKLSDIVRWEIFFQGQKNDITQIDYRLLAGTGPRFKVLGRPKFKIYAASLVMYENEKERTDPSIIHRDMRSSSYISFTLLPSDNIEINSTTFYQPLLKNFNDARLYNQLSLSFTISRHLSVNTKWNYLYDSKPAGTAPKTNYNFFTGFAVNIAPTAVN